MVFVARRVLTRLSPSVPPGLVSTLTLIVGFAAMNLFARSVANFSAAGSLPPASSEMVTGSAVVAVMVAPEREVRARLRRAIPQMTTVVRLAMTDMNASLGCGAGV